MNLTAPPPKPEGFHSEVTDHTLWDSWSGHACDKLFSHWDFFSRSTPGRPFHETNMDMPGMLALPSEFDVRRIVVTFSKDSDDADVAHLAEHGILEFWLGLKYYFRSVIVHMQAVTNDRTPIRVCSYCASVYVARANCPNCGAAEFRLPNIPGVDGVGRTVPSGMVYLADLTIPIYIHAGQYFKVRMSCDAPRLLSGRLQFWIHLQGFHVRGVQ